MTLYGAISNLVMMREHPMMPSMFYSSLDKIIETVSECEEPETNYSEIPNSWIPCSERLPEVNDTYLVSYEDASVLMDWFNGYWFFYQTNPAVEEIGTVVAWMPRPEPYQSKEESK